MNDACFIIAAIFVFYTYAGYPLILLILPKCLESSSSHNGVLPSITVLIAARNEAKDIGVTLQSILNLEYPHEMLRVIVISDASTDDTEKVVRTFNDRVELVRMEKRVGKYGALEAVLPQCTSEILVFADSSSVFAQDSINILVNHFSNPKVGAVTGTKCIINTDSSVAPGDGWYWRYDAWLRQMETRAGGSWVGVEGGFFGIRKKLFALDFPPYIAADYAIGCRVYEQGYLHLYDPAARIFERPSCGMQQEFYRKIRIIVRGIHALIYFRYLLNPLQYPLFSFQNISHRLMRWLVPYFLIILLVTSAFSRTGFIHSSFYLQLSFYILAVIGGIAQLSGTGARTLNIPWYFSVVNLAGLISWFLLYRQYETWTPTQRSAEHRQNNEN